MRIFVAILRCFVVIALTIYIGYFSFFCSKKAHETVCNEIRIEVKDSLQYQFVSALDIDVFLNEKKLNPRGKTIYDINLEKMEESLSQHTAIRTAKCYYSPSGMVCVDVWQREPLFRVMGLQSYFVDTDGNRMPLFAHNAVYVPIVSGAVNDSNVQHICEFVRFLNADEFWGAQVEQINVLSNGEFELTTRIGNHQLLLGEFDGFEKRLKKMQTFYQKGIDLLDWNVYKKFDLRYKNQVIGVK